MSKLRLFGARPANGIESVRAELDAYLAGEDALVVPTSHIPTFRGVLVTMLQMPAVAIGINLFALFLQLPLMLLRHREFVWIDPSEYETMAGDRPTHFVGEHPLERLASVGWPMIVGNWAVLLGSAVLDWRSMLPLVGLGLLVSVTISINRRQGYPRLAVGLFCIGFGATVWLLVAGYLNPLLVAAYALGAAVIIGWANNRMLKGVVDDTAAIAADHGYEEVCLVTNRATVTNLLENVADTDLTVADAFAQRRHGEGYHLDADGEPRDQPLLENTDDLFEERITAQFVDWAVVGGFLAVWLFVAGLTAGAGYIEWEATVVSGVSLTYTGLLLLSLAVPPTVYYTVTEGVWGQTIGKRVRDIRVVHTDGSSPSLRAAFTRTLVGWFDFAPVAYVFGGARIAGDDYNRRFGDLAAGTIVVETEAVRTDATDTETARPDSSPDEKPSAADEQGPQAEQSTTAPPETDTASGAEEKSGSDDAADASGDDAPTERTEEPTANTEGTEDATDESDTRSQVDAEWTAAALDDEE